MEIRPVGAVRNELKDPQFVKEQGKIVSRIEVFNEFADGLLKLDQQSYIDVVFQFDRSEDYELVTRIFSGETRGVFASRSPRRPNSLGVTTVKLLSREGNTLRVSGLDALDGTPVLDIKPADFNFMKSLGIEDDTPSDNPRFNILKFISRGETDQLLKSAGQIHGHYCPGLAMGVMASAHAMEVLRGNSDGMEDLLAIVETNNCFSDGVQYVTGCTFGNNALMFKDLGKNVVSLVHRDGTGVRVRAVNDIREQLGQAYPEFQHLFEEVVVKQNHDDNLVSRFRRVSREASFAMLQLPFHDLFVSEEVRIEVPPYAPIEESLICDHCGESFMASRGKKENGKTICKSCMGHSHPFLNGHGIHCG
ncbi:MAG: tRNA (N6-threonylcarbamoyladenosine(37)-N6)-methyltransferase TrmO [Bacteroidota bacterium]